MKCFPYYKGQKYNSKEEIKEVIKEENKLPEPGTSEFDSVMKEKAEQGIIPFAPRTHFASLNDEADYRLQTGDPKFTEYVKDWIEKTYPGINYKNITDLVDLYGSKVVAAALDHTMYIDPTSATQEQYIHELSHMYVDGLGMNDHIVKQLYEFAKGEPDDGVFDTEEKMIRIITNATNDLASDMYKGTRFEKLKRLLKLFWAKIKNIFGKANKKNLADIMAERIWKNKDKLTPEQVKANALHFMKNSKEYDHIMDKEKVTYTDPETQIRMSSVTEVMNKFHTPYENNEMALESTLEIIHNRSKYPKYAKMTNYEVKAFEIKRFNMINKFNEQTSLLVESIVKNKPLNEETKNFFTDNVVTVIKDFIDNIPGKKYANVVMPDFDNKIATTLDLIVDKQDGTHILYKFFTSRKSIYDSSGNPSSYYTKEFANEIMTGVLSNIKDTISNRRKLETALQGQLLNNSGNVSLEYVMVPLHINYDKNFKINAVKVEIPINYSPGPVMKKTLESVSSFAKKMFEQRVNTENKPRYKYSDTRPKELEDEAEETLLNLTGLTDLSIIKNQSEHISNLLFNNNGDFENKFLLRDLISKEDYDALRNNVNAFLYYLNTSNYHETHTPDPDDLTQTIVTRDISNFNDILSKSEKIGLPLYAKNKLNFFDSSDFDGWTDKEKQKEYDEYTEGFPIANKILDEIKTIPNLYNLSLEKIAQYRQELSNLHPFIQQYFDPLIGIVEYSKTYAEQIAHEHSLGYNGYRTFTVDTFLRSRDNYISKEFRNIIGLPALNVTDPPMFITDRHPQFQVLRGEVNKAHIYANHAIVAVNDQIDYLARQIDNLDLAFFPDNYKKDCLKLPITKDFSYNRYTGKKEVLSGSQNRLLSEFVNAVTDYFDNFDDNRFIKKAREENGNATVIRLPDTYKNNLDSALFDNEVVSYEDEDGKEIKTTLREYKHNVNVGKFNDEEDVKVTLKRLKKLIKQAKKSYYSAAGTPRRGNLPVKLITTKKKGKVKVGVLKQYLSQVIINHYLDRAIPIAKVFEKGYSGKRTPVMKQFGTNYINDKFYKIPSKSDMSIGKWSKVLDAMITGQAWVSMAWNFTAAPYNWWQAYVSAGNQLGYITATKDYLKYADTAIGLTKLIMTGKRTGFAALPETILKPLWNGTKLFTEKGVKGNHKIAVYATTIATLRREYRFENSWAKSRNFMQSNLILEMTSILSMEGIEKIGEKFRNISFIQLQMVELWNHGITVGLLTNDEYYKGINEDGSINEKYLSMSRLQQVIRISNLINGPYSDVERTHFFYSKIGQAAGQFFRWFPSKMVQAFGKGTMNIDTGTSEIGFVRSTINTLDLLTLQLIPGVKKRIQKKVSNMSQWDITNDVELRIKRIMEGKENIIRMDKKSRTRAFASLMFITLNSLVIISMLAGIRAFLTVDDNKKKKKKEEDTSWVLDMLKDPFIARIVSDNAEIGIVYNKIVSMLSLSANSGQPIFPSLSLIKYMCAFTYYTFMYAINEAGMENKKWKYQKDGIYGEKGDFKGWGVMGNFLPYGRLYQLGLRKYYADKKKQPVTPAVSNKPILHN